MTLVELLVAMTLGLLITLAATASLIAARRGFTTVDAASQLRDNARFATDLIQRLAVQSGYKDVSIAASKRGNTVGISADPDPYVYGFDNAVASRTSVTAASSRSSYFGDVLILRSQPTETFPGSGKADKGMIDCSGFSTETPPANRDDTRASVLFVSESSVDGEPTLKCYRSETGTVPFASAVPLIRGVENFQVLYGVDGVVAKTAIDPTNATLKPDTVPDSYLRADQLTVTGDDAATRANWRRVRSLRIGMVLRSDIGAAQESKAKTLYPLGGPGFSSTEDVGTIYTAPADGRLRQVVTFTVHLRNDQGL
ncbi:type IV pilus assembly protein PilW [Variovorax soli]|uniref:Type IV pilus assembly protein PilW n=2 Tax=Variovorax soli TaxID=376815 RepID=A0ABU1NGN7_9BURK|nr:type IV pilus assembly protein PilW [Variovorax soli]